MQTPAEQLGELEARFPGVLEFVRHCPFGLVGEHDMNSDDVTIHSQGSYCLMSWPPELPTHALLPGLIRLSVLVLDDCGLELGSHHTTYYEELIWFYAYAKAQAMTGLDHGQLLPPGVARRWRSIAAELCSRSELNEFDYLRLSLIVGYAVPGALLLHPIEHRLYRRAWELAREAKNFSSFFAEYRRIGGPDCKSTSTLVFMRMNPPKKRAVLHTCYGRVSGAVATTRAPWVGGRDGILSLRQRMFDRSLMFENHDLDRPVGLIANPHVVERDDGHFALHAEILVFDERHWSRRDEFKGFSLGIQHE